MVKVVGIDPGTRSFDLCGLEDGGMESLEMKPKIIGSYYDPGSQKLFL